MTDERSRQADRVEVLALADEDRELLAGLYSDRWLRPMDLGGTDSSDHSRRLAKLTRKGLVERRKRNTLANELGGRRGSYVYRLAARANQGDTHE